MKINEIILKGIKYADGFEETPGVGITFNGDDNLQPWDTVYFPFLLTRIIEGINRAADKYFIWQLYDEIHAISINYKTDNDGYVHGHDRTTNESIQKAKLAVITYVLERDGK